MKKHRFIVTVETEKSIREAKRALLVAWARRQPDGCKFSVAEIRQPKAAPRGTP